MTVPTLLSVNVGLPKDIQWRGQTVRTAIWKSPVPGRCVVRRLNLDGDGQGDLGGHGGEHRAVMVYQVESYRYWERYLNRNDFSYGQFGENFTVEGLADDEVCIGDRYRIGTALFEVTQPRVTCYRVGIRMNVPDMASLLVSHHKPGFYFRVIEEGEVGARDEIVKVNADPESVTIAEIDALLYLPGHRNDKLDRFLKIPALSSGWKTSLQALSAHASSSNGTGNPGLTGSSGSPPAWSGFKPLRVSRVDEESGEIRSFTFAAMDGSTLPSAAPGQFIVIRIRPSANTSPVLRNYSLSGDPSAKSYRISVKREARGVASAFIHGNVNAGDMVEVSAPRGAFTLRAGGGPVVLVSAGIGVTPVLAMLYTLASATSLKRDVWWVYGARNSDTHPFVSEVKKLLDRLPGSRRYVAYSRPGSADRLGIDYDAVGHMDVSILQRIGAPLNGEYYLCGPPSFIRDLTSGLGAWGIPANRIYSEAFGPGESLNPGIVNAAKSPVHVPVGVPGAGPQVSFTRSALTVPWSPRFQSLLELAEACDVPVRWSCRTGVCHNCESGLIDGRVNYRPEPLDAAATGNVLICCSQPVGDVQLDL